MTSLVATAEDRARMRSLEAAASSPAATEPTAEPSVSFSWDKARKESRTVEDFLNTLLKSLHRLPAGQRPEELDKLLRKIDPSLADGVLSETQLLMSQGHAPPRALRAALGAALAARRKKHFWITTRIIIPFQAEKVATGIYQVSEDPAERAKRIGQLVAALRPPRPVRYRKRDAHARLREVGLSTAEIEATLRAPYVTADDVSRRVATLMEEGVAPREALRSGVEYAMRAYFLDGIKSHGVAKGQYFCTWITALVGGVVALATATIPMITGAVHEARQARRARAAQDRQRKSPLMAGEIEQIVTALIRSGATTWGPAQRQAALDYIRVNRFTRTNFIEPEEQQLQAAFNNARAAIVAQQEAARRAQERKTLLAVGGVAAVLVVGAVIYKARA